MTETSERAAAFDRIEAHTAALFQMMPKGPPDWAHHDLTFGQLRLLFMLRQSGSVSIGQLADMLAVTAATASEFVDRVERRGLVVRIHRADDRRVVDCQLSDEGARLLGQIEGARQELKKLVGVLWANEARAAVSIRVREGRADEVIIHEAGNTHASLIIMGMRNCSWLSGLLRRHTVKRVLQNAPCPVMVLRPGMTALLRGEQVALETRERDGLTESWFDNARLQAAALAVSLRTSSAG